MEQLNTGNQHWDRIADYATEEMIMDMSSIRYATDGIESEIIHQNNGATTKKVVVYGDRCCSYYQKTFAASGKQVEYYRDIHDRISCSSTRIYLGDRVADGRMDVVLRDAGKPITAAGGIKHGPLLGWVGIHGAAHALLHTLAFAESRGVVHRDIKPPHVVETTGRVPEGFSRITVIDWDGSVIIEGLEQAIADGIVPAVSGTPGLLAPEVRAAMKKAKRGKLTASEAAAITTSKLDVYSTGCTLYKLMTGYCPPKDTRGGLSWPPAFPSAWPHLAELKQLVESCLAYDAADRPTFAQLLEQHGAWLEPFNGDQPRASAAHTALRAAETRGQAHYMALKHKQPVLYKQQKAWCNAAAKSEPNLKGAKLVLLQVLTGASKVQQWGRKCQAEARLLLQGHFAAVFRNRPVVVQQHEIMQQPRGMTVQELMAYLQEAAPQQQVAAAPVAAA